MAMPKYHEFMKPILELLVDDQVHKRNDIYENLSVRCGLTDLEMEEWLPSGKQLVYKNRIGWALTYLKKAELIESTERAAFRITELGKSVLDEDPVTVDQEYLQRFEGFRGFVDSVNIGPGDGKSSTDAVSSESPQDMLDSAYITISNSLADDVLSEVMNQTPDFFEKLVVDLLVAMGYGDGKKENSQVIGKSGDEGIDGVIREEKLGFDRIYIQAKRWNLDKTVGRPELQKFVGAITGQGATKGAFITTARFTSEAVDYARIQRVCKIVLIDGHTLAKLMIEHNMGVAVENTYLIKRIDSDYFSD